MLKSWKKISVYLLILVLVGNFCYVIGVSSNGGDPTVDQYLGIFNFPWFNASEGVDAPNYYRNGENLTEWIESISGGVSDHGSLTGLDDDDHSLYLLQDGSEGLTGNWDVGEYDFTAKDITADEFYRLGLGNYTAWIESISGSSGTQLLPDYVIYSNGTSPYAVNDLGTVVSSHASDSKVVYDYCRSQLTGGGWIHFKGGTFSFSGKIYLQSKGGGGIPDYDNYCILTGNGAQGTAGLDSGATLLKFPAGSDGIIIDMHTNNGGWYTRSSLRDLSIAGAYQNNMDRAIVLLKTADVEIDNVITYYAGSNGVAIHIVNTQMLSVNRLRHYCSIPNEVGIKIENMDGVTYTEQGAHHTFTRISVGLVGGTDGAGQIAWELNIDNGTANLGNMAFIDCEAMISGTIPATPRIGWYIHNTAGGFEDIVWTSSNFEGGDKDSGERSIKVDTNVGYFYGELQGCSFPGSGTSIQMDHSTSRLIVRQSKSGPDQISGPGCYYWEYTDTPGTITASNVFAGLGTNVMNDGTASITGAVTSFSVAHGISMSLSTNLPSITVSPLQSGSGDFWVSNKNSTHFDINFTNQPDGSTWYFDWSGTL